MNIENPHTETLNQIEVSWSHINPIRNEEDYNKAMDRIDTIFDAMPNTIEGKELNILADLVELYEIRQGWAIDI